MNVLRHSALTTRRDFLRAAAAGSLAASVDLAFLAKLPPVSAAEARLEPGRVRFRPEIEPLVRLLEETPREALLEEVGRRVGNELSYRDLLAALLLAGVRDIQPRPVGFKFHAVLVVHSAHLASLASPGQDRWLPIFWALDQFKRSQAEDARAGDWTLGTVREPDVPAADKALRAFRQAMDRWDVEAADAAAAAFARSAPRERLFDVYCRYGARDFRDIGHKAIYVANGWRTLQVIGWDNAEPVLRSMAYALLDHEEGNPAEREAEADRDGRRNLELIGRIPEGWGGGQARPEATTELLSVLRQGSSTDACEKAVAMLQKGAALQSIWDALFVYSGELLMRRPGIIALHAVTTTNAIHYAFATALSDDARRYLLLQSAAFLVRFRNALGQLADLSVDTLEPAKVNKPEAPILADIFATLSRDRLAAARLVLGYLQEGGDPQALADAARRLIFLKGNNSHDYKFSSAVLEDYRHISPGWRDRYLACSVFSLRGSGDADNELVGRARAALGG